MLNGYPTNDPLKKKAETLDMTIFTSFARKSSVDQIRDIIDTNFHVKDISIHSQSLVSFTVISDTWHELTQYIIADVTSQLTELVSVRRGALSEAYSFPKGKQFLIKTIADGLNVSSEVAESLLHMKNEGKIEEDLDKKLSVALQTAKKDWLKSFSESLVVMSASSSLPSNFFLFAPKDVVQIFSEYITNEEYQQFSFAEGKFQVKNINVSDLLPYCKIENGAIGDLSLMIGAIFNTKMKSL
jgi:cell division ATPase FtsA